jgi:hypothetical protein
MVSDSGGLSGKAASVFASCAASVECRCDARGSASAHVLERPHEQGVSAPGWCIARAGRLRSKGLCVRTGEAVSAVESVLVARFSRGVRSPGNGRVCARALVAASAVAAVLELLPFGVGVVRGSRWRGMVFWLQVVKYWSTGSLVPLGYLSHVLLLNSVIGHSSGG